MSESVLDHVLPIFTPTVAPEPTQNAKETAASDVSLAQVGERIGNLLRASEAGALALYIECGSIASDGLLAHLKANPGGRPSGIQIIQGRITERTGQSYKVDVMLAVHALFKLACEDNDISWEHVPLRHVKELMTKLVYRREVATEKWELIPHATKEIVELCRLIDNRYSGRDPDGQMLPYDDCSTRVDKIILLHTQRESDALRKEADELAAQAKRTRNEKEANSFKVASESRIEEANGLDAKAKLLQDKINRKPAPTRVPELSEAQKTEIANIWISDLAKNETATDQRADLAGRLVGKNDRCIMRLMRNLDGGSLKSAHVSAILAGIDQDETVKGLYDYFSDYPEVYARIVKLMGRGSKSREVTPSGGRKRKANVPTPIVERSESVVVDDGTTNGVAGIPDTDYSSHPNPIVAETEADLEETPEEAAM